MPWIITTARGSGRFEPTDDVDDEYPLNGFACVGEIRAFAISCPVCGTRYDIDAQVPRPRVFDRQQQVFRCPGCRFKAEVRLTVDIGFADDRERAVEE